MSEKIPPKNKYEKNDGSRSNPSPMSRRAFIKGAASLGAATALLKIPKAEAQPASEFLQHILDTLTPNEEAILELINEIAMRKWNDPVIRKRLFETHSELGGKTIPEFAQHYGSEPFLNIFAKFPVMTPNIQALAVTGEMLPGLILQESSLDPEALSGSGAIGLGQITGHALKDSIRRNPIFSTFAQSAGVDVRTTKFGALELARTHLQENMLNYIEKQMNLLASKLGLTFIQHGSIWAFCAVNAYNAGHIPVRKLILNYCDRPTEFSQSIDKNTSVNEIFADMVIDFYSKQKEIPEAAYKKEAATYVFLVLGATFASAWAIKEQMKERMRKRAEKKNK